MIGRVGGTSRMLSSLVPQEHINSTAMAIKSSSHKQSLDRELQVEDKCLVRSWHSLHVETMCCCSKDYTGGHAKAELVPIWETGTKTTMAELVPIWGTGTKAIMGYCFSYWAVKGSRNRRQTKVCKAKWNYPLSDSRSYLYWEFWVSPTWISRTQTTESWILCHLEYLSH